MSILKAGRGRRAQVPNPDTLCWGRLSRTMGYCLKKPRPGHLTCWSHQFAESNAQRLKKERDEGVKK